MSGRLPTPGHGFGALLHECPDPAFLLEAGTGRLVGNGRLAQLTGYEEISGTRLLRILGSEDRRPLLDELRLVLGGATRHRRVGITARGGSPLDIDFTGIPLPDATGAVTAVLGVGVVVREIQRLPPRDATPRHDWMGDLLLSTIDQIDLGVYYLDRDFRITFVNETGARYLRSTPGGLLDRRFPELFPDAWAGPFGAAYQDALREQKVTTVRAHYAPFGKWFEATAYPTESGLAVDLRDVTDDQERRRRLEETTARLGAQAALLDAARDAMTVRELDHRVRYWNRGAEELFGWGADELIGRSVRDLLYPDPLLFDLRTEEVLRVGHWAGELLQRTRDGRVIIVDCRWQLLRDADGAPSAIFAVESDITEYRKSEEERYRAQRLESLGTLAGGIAHDLNNVLTPVLMASQLLVSDEQDARRRELLRSIESAAERGASLIRRVLEFAKGHEGRRRILPVTSLLEEVATFCREAVPTSVSVSVEAPPELPAVLGDPTQLMQVLINLVTNARDAMPYGGRLVIGAGVCPGARDVGSHGDPGDSVVLSVTDSGVGMDAEVVARIFEPFFSTKGPDRGTGLGLPTSAAIVKAHGGRITVESRPGRGSSFAVILPVATGAESVRDAPAEGPGVRVGNGELILVADDDAAVRGTIRRVLKAHGYRVTEAANGVEAVDAAQDPEVALVLVDLMMPVLGGADVIDRLVFRRPGIPLIAMSGFDGDGRGEAAARAGFASFLPKPFSAATLLGAVGEALEKETVA